MNGTVAPQGHEILSARIRSLLPGYIVKQTFQVGRVAVLLASGEFEEIGRIGHAISGTGSGYGLQRLGSLGAAIEEAAVSQDSDAISRYEAALTQMLEGLQT